MFQLDKEDFEIHLSCYLLSVTVFALSYQELIKQKSLILFQNAIKNAHQTFSSYNFVRGFVSTK
jgi:hypothetical protein